MFWERFVNECEKVNKKPNPVAKELKISSGTVTGWKNGAIPNSVALDKLSNYFNVSIDYLLGREDAKTPPSKKDGTTDKELKFALWGAEDGITDGMLDDVRRFAEFIAQKKRNSEKD